MKSERSDGIDDLAGYGVHDPTYRSNAQAL
jgi:hypothetical protein